MIDVKLEVETITPLFIAGADQRNIENDGLRTPSLRGLLRWWFRATMGGMVSIRNLKELENKIFGSINKKSCVKILTVSGTQPSQINVQSDLRYLWFSIHMQKRNYQRLQCYPPGTKFKIMLSSYDENSLKIALGCLWTLIYLGGIGARMRRGAGSLKVNNVSGETPYGFVFNGSTINDAKNFIEENLVKIFKDFKEYAGVKYNPQVNSNFAVLSHAKICLINQPFNRWEDGLEKVSNEYRSHRANKDVTERFIWGLPILSRQNLKRYENSLRKILNKSKKDVNKEIKRLKGLKEKELLREIEISKDRIKQVYLKLLLLEKLRQASPLFIGVMDLNGTSYSIRLVKFYTSIHLDFSSKIAFLKQDLDNFNSKLAKSKDLGEIEIKIPEVK